MSHVLPFSSTSVLFHVAYDGPTEAVLEVGRGRNALREIGTSTTDPREAWRIVRLLEEEALALQTVRELVLLHFEKLEGR